MNKLSLEEIKSLSDPDKTVVLTDPFIVKVLNDPGAPTEESKAGLEMKAHGLSSLLEGDKLFFFFESEETIKGDTPKHSIEFTTFRVATYGVNWVCYRES